MTGCGGYGGADAPPPRVRERGGIDPGRMGGGDPHPHRDGPHHGGSPPGVHPLVGFAGTLDARRRPCQPASGGRHGLAVLGPFHVPGAPLREYGANLAEQPAGDPRRGRRADPRRPGPADPGRQRLATATTGCTRCRTRNRFRRITCAGFLAREDAATPSSPCGPSRTLSPAMTARRGDAGRGWPSPWAAAHLDRACAWASARSPPTRSFDLLARSRLRRRVRRQASLVAGIRAAPTASHPDTPAGVGSAWFDVANDIVLTPADEPREPTDPGRTA